MNSKPPVVIDIDSETRARLLKALGILRNECAIYAYENVWDGVNQGEAEAIREAKAAERDWFDVEDASLPITASKAARYARNLAALPRCCIHPYGDQYLGEFLAVIDDLRNLVANARLKAGLKTA